ncbi:hypothetical protein F917_02883 [Acinetobacter baumannii NIPH 67]|uniref:restriction endonuclease subunit S n=2 Tax=Acinetobacter baumannii TaxID=470 RepID=UPI0002CE5888|nr:restriction endonuclease subunit S [Acinetobacter baumannii]ENW49007.1 hypothetical protein F917_02883 [Acinetobacter baumannii NIPH 67]MDC4834914.1 restriction endonuclease subunit S [Acinetobacter baumannii]
MSQFELPDSWAFTTISEVAIKGDQRAPDQDETFTYVDIGSIDRVLKRISDPQILMGKNAPSRARKAIRNGDVLVSLTRPNLNAVALVTSEFDGQIASTGFEVIRPCLVDSRYIFGLTRSKEFIDSISGAVQGALYPAAKSSDVQGFKFPLPPLAEQKIIADKLDTLLAQVESIKARLERITEILKQFRQSVLAAAVSGKLTEEWRKLNDKGGFSETTWEGILRDKKNSFKRGPFGSALKKSMFVESGFKVYEQYCPINDDCTYARYYITPEKFEEMKAFEVLDGDFLISCSGVSLGRITQVPFGSERGIINQALLRVRLNNQLYNDDFFKLVFRSPSFQKDLFENSTGSAIPNLKGVKELKAMVIPLPSLNEQEKIVELVNHHFEAISGIDECVRSALDRVNSLTQSILAKAFRGELTAEWREANPELISGENSAEALLERIKAERTSVKSATKRGRAKT